MNHSMEDLVDRSCVGQSWVRFVCRDLRLSNRLQKGNNSSKKNLRLLKIYRKVMQTKGERLWSLKKGIGFLLRCPSKKHISIWEKKEVSP